MTDPKCLIMILNRETHDLRRFAALPVEEAQAAFENLTAAFAGTPNDVHMVEIPDISGFCSGGIETSKGTVAKPAPKRAQPAPTIAAPNGASDEDDPDNELAYGRWV